MTSRERILEDVEASRRLAEKAGRRVTLMEVCGTHTVSICRSGLAELLGESVRLVSGPGCPVCVSTQGYIDACVGLSKRRHVTIATYGDMLRVPGSVTSLAEARAQGARVLTVYSAADAVRYAAEHPGERIVFAAVGFETTAPGTALALKSVMGSGVRNFTVLCSHKRILPAMMALAEAEDLSVDGFICPGHVSVIVGPEEYEPVAAAGRPCVVAGFEGPDVARAVRMLLEQVAAGESRVENAYERVVKPGGNRVARELLREVFDICDEKWRGLGEIAGSGLAPRGEFRQFDARKVHGVQIAEVAEPAGCRCGEVIKGAIDPEECGLFGKGCTPARPVGPCMVSREGSCSAHYKYARRTV